jgi:hypothetical protein
MTRALLLTAVFWCATSGCGPSGPKAGRIDNDPASYARTTKKRVLDFVQEAWSNPRGIPQEAAALLETLEVYPSQPVGEHKSTYETLTQKCKSLVDQAKRAPTSGEVQKLLQEMQTLANQLPG